MIIGFEYELFIKFKPTFATRPGDEIYIITRRRNRREMINELKELGLSYHKLLNFVSDEEFDSHDVIRHKKKIIYYYQIPKYYEDNSNEAKTLKQLCPTCEVILLNNFNNTKDD